MGLFGGGNSKKSYTTTNTSVQQNVTDEGIAVGANSSIGNLTIQRLDADIVDNAIDANTTAVFGGYKLAEDLGFAGLNTAESLSQNMEDVTRDAMILNHDIARETMITAENLSSQSNELASSLGIEAMTLADNISFGVMSENAQMRQDMRDIYNDSYGVVERASDKILSSTDKVVEAYETLGQLEHDVYSEFADDIGSIYNESMNREAIRSAESLDTITSLYGSTLAALTTAEDQARESVDSATRLAGERISDAYKTASQKATPLDINKTAMIGGVVLVAALLFMRRK